MPQQTQRGFIPSPIKTGDYILGGAVQLKGAVLRPDGQWDAYLPAPENQSRDGFEPYACVSYAIKHAVEILIRQEFGELDQYSARWLAWATGTEAKQGNDPWTVCHFLGTSGDVHEADWPYDSQHFYDTPPQTMYTLAKEFIAKWNYDNQWVPATQATMMDALTRSPLTVAGFAWAQNAAGLYYWPDGAISDHYFIVYGYDPNNYWKVFDTYENNYKQLVWDYPFIQLKEHTIHANVVVPSYFDKFVQYLRESLGLDGMAFGAARSPQWPQVQKAFIKEHPTCAVCDKKGTLLNPLNVHHQHPFHVHPELELDPENLITLCRIHHLWWGHLGNWASWNDSVQSDAVEWELKIKARP